VEDRTGFAGGDKDSDEPEALHAAKTRANADAATARLFRRFSMGDVSFQPVGRPDRSASTAQSRWDHAPIKPSGCRRRASMRPSRSP
jgi:hypothetical protein